MLRPPALHAVTIVILALTTSCCSSGGGFFGPPDNGLGGRCITVDSTPNDEALDCVRLIASGAKPDATSLEAAMNLESCTSAQKDLPITVVGHGFSGIIITGDGQFVLHDDKFIGELEPKYWVDEFKNRLGTGTGRQGLITLLACDTGKDPFGPTLLKEMVEATGRPVRARTGLVYCDCADGKRLITFEEGTRWRTVSPQSPNVSPAEASQSYGPPPRPERSINKEAAARNMTFDLAHVTTVEIRNEVRKGVHEWRRLPPESGRRLVNLIEFDEAVRKGAPLAVITGLIRLTIVDGPIEECRTLIIYNDRLVRDTADKRTYYYTADAFAPFFASLLDR